MNDRMKVKMKNAKEAIDLVFSDVSEPAEITRDCMQELGEEIQIKIEALEVMISE